MEDEEYSLESLKPVEGTTGWSDTWMAYQRAKNPNCLYLWLDYVGSAQVQARIAESTGQAPVNLDACELTEVEDHCVTLHADDEVWWEDVYYPEHASSRLRRSRPRGDVQDARGVESSLGAAAPVSLGLRSRESYGVETPVGTGQATPVPPRPQ